MKELSNPDRFQIEAAEGWLMLGNPIEANEELEKISPENRRHPAALSVRWQVYAAAEWWEAAWVVSKVLCEVLPDSPEAWICQANTVRKYKGVREALDVLQIAHKRFREHAVVLYNMACYASQVARFEEAGRWLTEAFRAEDGIALKVAAVYDPDLRPLWEKVGDVRLLELHAETK
jgi:tetratricopeptide (TPR) repeat protein